jgi:hypothetical protein
MANKYDEASFWAGVALGQQLKGWSAFGIIDGFDPDGGLIVRPIQQGIPVITFARDTAFTILSMTDTVNEVDTTQNPAPIEINEEISAIVFQRDTEFAVMPLTEDIHASVVVKYFIMNRTTNTPSYNEAYVKSNTSGFRLVTSYTEYSVSEEIDSGNMQALRVDTSRFESMTTQGVT